MKNLILITILMAAGCTTVSDSTNSSQKYVTNMASYDFDCDKTEISIEKVGTLSYSAVGCGNNAVYKCKNISSWWDSINIECNREKL